MDTFTGQEKTAQLPPLRVRSQTCPLFPENPQGKKKGFLSLSLLQGRGQESIPEVSLTQGVINI